MKTDIDGLMSDHNIDALLVTGGTRNNPNMYYLTNGAQVGEATMVIKKRGSNPVIIAIGMERLEAEKSGLKVINREDYGWSGIIHEEGGDDLAASASLLAVILRDLQVTGNVGVYGRAEHSYTMLMFEALQERLPDVHLVAEAAPSLLQLAQQTKGTYEIDRIRCLASAAVSVIRRTRQFLGSHSVENGILIQSSGAPLTVREVKHKIRRWTCARDMELPEGMIFSVGSDSAVPHARGDDKSILELGRTIVFDYFPREQDGGYFCDFTRTWCLGYAPPEVEQAYHDVFDALELSISSLRAGNMCIDSQIEVNKLFEVRGHPTMRSVPGTSEGYIHSLGHGVGLSLHQYPKLSDIAGDENEIQSSTVLTIEPGLYYPSQGYGIRIEDMVLIDPENGCAERIGEFDRELVIDI